MAIRFRRDISSTQIAQCLVKCKHFKFSRVFYFQFVCFDKGLNIKLLTQDEVVLLLLKCSCFMIIQFVKITLLDRFFYYLVTIRSKIEILNLEIDHLGNVDFLNRNFAILKNNLRLKLIIIKQLHFSNRRTISS